MLIKLNHRILNYAELEGIHHHVQPLAVHILDHPQESHHVHERVVQMLLELDRLGAVTTSLQSLLQCPATLWVKTFS